MILLSLLFFIYKTNKIGYNIIAGSRSITDFDISPYIPEGTDLIISGGAKGIDTLAEQYADKKKLSKFISRSNYARYKKGAPLLRNKDMVDYADKVLIFWDSASKGTKQTIDYAEKRGKLLQVIEV